MVTSIGSFSVYHYSLDIAFVQVYRKSYNTYQLVTIIIPQRILRSVKKIFTVIVPTRRRRSFYEFRLSKPKEGFTTLIDATDLLIYLIRRPT